MYLKTISIENFRCYDNLNDVPLHKLTVFIGENDAGKSVLLDAIRILVTENRPQSTDYRQISKNLCSETITLKGTFELSPDSQLPTEWRSNKNSSFTLKKTFTATGSSTCEVFGRKIKNPKLSNFHDKDANTQKELLKELGHQPAATKDLRADQLKELVLNGAIEMEEGFSSVPFIAFSRYLPGFELTSSAEFEQPHLLVQKTLQSVVNACIRELPDDSEATPPLIPILQDAHNIIEEALNSKMREAVDALKTVYPKIKDISTNPKIDFAKSVQIPELLLDCDDGQGAKSISSFGDGTKKRMWMGLLDWQRQAQKQVERAAIIRAYDEPDMSLHYDAQRKLFANMVAAASDHDSKTQVIVCTHSLALVDRAPGESINLIKVNEDGVRKVEYLHGDSDPEIKEFLSAVSRSVGISNSALFYERVFLIVEGESEENALPILYKTLYRKTLIEDGIVLINLKGSAGWQPFLKLLGANKENSTLLLLDSDCQATGSGSRVTPSRLESIGFTNDFIQENIFLIGQKEFEDSFRTLDILSVLNKYYPRQDNKSWEENDVDMHRSETNFMKPLLSLIRTKCHPDRHPFLKKPDFATYLAVKCVTTEQVPTKVRELFDKARKLAT